MFSYGIDKLAKAEFDRIIESIPLFRKVRQQSEAQFKLLLQYSSLFLAKQNETVIRKGDFDAWCYYLLSGHLNVYPESGAADEICIAKLQTGDMFGALALLQDLERNATIRVADESEYVVLLGVDFAPFGDLDDFEEVTLATKIVFYEEVYMRLMKRIKHYVMAYPKNPAAKSRDLNIKFIEDKTSFEYLQYLNDTSLKLSKWLGNWNLSLDQISALDFKEMDIEQDLLSNIKETLWNQHQKAS